MYTLSHFLNWLWTRTAFKTLQVGKPAVLLLVGRILFLHHWSHMRPGDWALTHLLGHRAHERQAWPLQSEPSLDLGSVFVITRHRECEHMWPAKHGRGKGPPCPRVCILKQQGWWHRWRLDTVEGEKPEVIRCLCSRGERQSQTMVRQSVYPNSPGGLFFTPTWLLTSIFRKLAQRQRNRYKDFPYTQPLPQELPTFVNLVSCTYPLFFPPQVF